MISRLYISLILMSCFQITQAQKSAIGKIEVDKILIESGEFRNYYQYDLGDFYFLNGRFENNLKFKIKEKLMDSIVLNYNDSLSDAMILKPVFFKNDDLKIILIMIEVAAEYSWGQEVVLINDGEITKPGYLDFAVDLGNGLSISDYCQVSLENEKIVLTFDNVPIIYWPEESTTINGSELKFEIKHDKIERMQ